MIMTVTVLAVALYGGVALAGQYHTGTTLVCTDCHTMHASQAHKYSDGTAPSTTPISPTGDWFPGNVASAHLLKASGSDLCLACHDATAVAPDVYKENTGGFTGAATVRSAGAVNKTTDTSGTYQIWMGHTIGNVGTPPGGGTSITLNCVSCHDQHGNAFYRNVNAGSVSYTAATSPDNTKDVWVNTTSGSRYEQSNIKFMSNADPTNNAMSEFCASCHGSFHGGTVTDTDTGDGANFKRHPTEQALFGGVGGGKHTTTALGDGLTAADSIRVQATWTGAAAFTSGTARVMCLSCHKAHGNTRAFGLIYGNNTDEAGTGTAPKALCDTCHP
jgi:hypothetical protein